MDSYGTQIEGILSAAIANELITDECPVAMFMDLSRVEERVEELHRAFPSSWCHAFAVKANPLKEVMKIMKEKGSGAECASIVEVEHAIRLGFDTEKIIFDSPCKTNRDIIRCLELGVLMNLDSLNELARVAGIMERYPQFASGARIGLRVNPQIGPGTIECTSTATVSSKFGIGIKDSYAEIKQAFSDYPFITGLHSHIGSQGCPMSMLVEGTLSLVELAQSVGAQWLDIGGGLSTSYDGVDELHSFSEYASVLKEKAPILFEGKFKIYTEFGRAMVQKYGWIVSKVEETKTSGGVDIAVCHIGSNLLLRTCYLPDMWPHYITIHNPTGDYVTSQDTVSYDIAGPLCFSADIIAHNRKLPRIQRGYYLVVHDAGGYTLSMYSRYNSRPAPPVFGYNKQSEISLLKPGESVEDVLQFWG